MRRIVFVSLKDRGHIHAATALTRGLEDLGFHVSFVGPPSARRIFEDLGRDFTSVESLDLLTLPFGIMRRPLDFKGSGGAGRLRHAARIARDEVGKFQESFGEIQSELDEVIDKLRPEMAIFDPFMLVYSIPFLSRNVPVVTISSKPLATPDTQVPPYTEYLRPGMPLFRARVWLLWLRQRVYYALWERWERLLGGASLGDLVVRFGKASGTETKRFWRPRPFLFDSRFCHCAEWVLHAREFDLPRLREPDGEVHYVGPVADLDRHEQPVTIQASGRPIVYAALSTVRKAGPMSRRRILDEWLCLASHRPDLFFIISADDHAEAILAAGVPENVQVFSFAPSIQILRQASVLMAQAGGNVVKEAIWNDVPILVLPIRADQPGIAARVLFHGLGLAHPRLPSWRTLSRDIDALLNDPAYRERVIAMRKMFESYSDLRALSNAVNSALGKRSTSENG